ncbi:MAG: glycoside hydrolase family 15 protein [Humibacillus sp.]|nr:glycoside hydrolase family 15 protein [Humibacillus sp.]MDN5779750.1 glycoside hydrolase family 15 protein [Humibacillus sp.]
MSGRQGSSLVPQRIDGYAPIEAYAAIGDGRTVALVSADGAIDWWCLPDIDGAAACWALLDAEGGGRMTLQPTTEYTVSRRYVANTNVLETTYTTATGQVRVTDALLLGEPGLAPLRELYRRVDGVSGRVTMRWQFAPRFDFGRTPTRFVWRAGVPVAQGRGQALAVCTWAAGDAELGSNEAWAQFTLDAGGSAGILLAYAGGEPLVLPPRGEVDARLRETCRTWREWAKSRSYDGRWREAVVRSALALKLLVHAPSGALAAAATTALPEMIGGERNWDYRYCWVRDSAFILDTLTSLGCAPEAEAFFWWLMHASALTHPRLQVLYRLDGGAEAPESELALDGYRGSRPVRVGNAAQGQLQLDVYGDLLEAAWRYAHTCGTIDPEIARRLAQTADLVADVWRQPDSGIWEVRSEPQHFTQSKMMCVIALERAAALADLGILPSRHASHWRAEAKAVRDFVERNCWSPDAGAYVRAAGSTDLDASVLLAVLFGYAPPADERLRSTVDAIGERLVHGPFVARYTGDDGLAGSEGAFLACSFWLVEALARTGRRPRATALFEELLTHANDVGLYSEEVDPGSGAFLGNFPQGLTHLALISAATALAGEGSRP